MKSKIIHLLWDHFNYNYYKVTAWLNTENPLLGGVSPLYMLENGKEEKLLKFIETQLGENNED